MALNSQRKPRVNRYCIFGVLRHLSEKRE